MSSSSEFSNLPAHLKRRIDHAFESAADDQPSSLPPKKRKTHTSASVVTSGFVASEAVIQPGGFIVEDDQLKGGGFVVEDTEPGGFVVEDSTPQFTHIPLSRIPTALQLLDLQPDDEEVLSVFRNAAFGWTSGPRHSSRSHSPPDQKPEQEAVSREDWRTVCAVLLESHDGEHESAGVAEGSNGEGRTGVLDFNEESDPESDEYRYEVYSNGEESDFEDSDEEYIEGASSSRPRTQPKSKATRKPRSRSPPASTFTASRKLTSRQKEECRRAFALFFPDALTSSDELDQKKIMIKDISRAATVLKEKITAEEIVEMLEVFSTSADKSVSLRDFERMMVAVKLV